MVFSRRCPHRRVPILIAVGIPTARSFVPHDGVSGLVAACFMLSALRKIVTPFPIAGVRRQAGIVIISYSPPIFAVVAIGSRAWPYFLAKLVPTASSAEKRNSLHRGEHRVKPVFALLPKKTATPSDRWFNGAIYAPISAMSTGEANAMDRAAFLANVSGLVVKIGTNALTGSDGRLDHDVIVALAADLAGLWRREQIRITLVSSGAIGAGMTELGIKTRPRDLPMLQSAAAVGQGLLMNYFAAAFKPHGLHVGQILVTRYDFEDRPRYLNLRNCIHALHRCAALPIINENDAVAVEEIRFGDNDLIAAHVTNLLQADLLILLSVVDGLLDAAGGVRPLVEDVDESVTQLVRDRKSSRGSGGMGGKLLAAGTVRTAGEPVIIANGKVPGIVRRLLAGEPLGTLVLPGKRRLSARSRWIGLTARVRGTMVVDAGAAAALRNNKSLLAGGIVGSDGDFTPGDPVAILDASGQLLARGLSNYSRADVEKIKGHRSREFARLLQCDTWYDEVVHRDDLVLEP